LIELAVVTLVGAMVSGAGCNRAEKLDEPHAVADTPAAAQTTQPPGRVEPGEPAVKLHAPPEVVAEREQVAEPDPFAEARRRMVETQLEARDITDPRVLAAMGKVPRHLFVPERLRHEAYNDYPLPIGHDQTISQPYIVALMTQLAAPKPDSIALDVGTGSGYQAAILAELCKEVYSIEIIKELADEASERLKRLGYKNVQVRCGDGYRGWPEKAPFDVIIVAAAPDHIPEPLVNQLGPGGRLVIPVGRFFQELMLVEKLADGTVRKRSIIPVSFVPMTGEALRKKK
jgi:protein-L-isoaspartate(D-aspartate) O-methyltransferase